jgi:acyl-coenzyme A synthetase/AMP-(fatty) acid ligase
MKESLVHRLINLTWPDDKILLFKSDGSGKTIKEYRSAVASLRSALPVEKQSAIIHTQELWPFAIALIGSLSAGKKVIIPGFADIDMISNPEYTDAVFLGDKNTHGFIDIDSITNEKIINPEIPITKKPGRIVLLTSGSSGKARLFEKETHQIEEELDTLSSLWINRYSGSAVYSTVSHQHLYGFLFSFLVPWCSGIPIFEKRIVYPEYIRNPYYEKITLVSSPAFLKRMSEIENSPSLTSRIKTIFSSGGPLPETVARSIENTLNTQVWEIFGSTETGGIAYRRISENKAWKAFKGVDITINNQNCIVIQSDYMKSREPYTTADLARTGKNGTFHLIGRKDSIVKIEETRISLDEVATRLEFLKEVNSAKVILLEGRRQYLAAVVVLSQEVSTHITESDRKDLIYKLKSYLSCYFPAVTIPKKWRFIEEFPMDTQSKIRLSDLKALFKTHVDNLNYSIVYLNPAKGMLRCRLFFNPDHPFFQGHFPQSPILPAVAQLFTALMIARRHLDIGDDFHFISSLKFSKPILPDDRITLEITINQTYDTLIYILKDHDGEMVSKGIVKKKFN